LRASLATARAWPLALFAGGHKSGNGLPVVNGQMVMRQQAHGAREAGGQMVIDQQALDTQVRATTARLPVVNGQMVMRQKLVARRSARRETARG